MSEKNKPKNASVTPPQAAPAPYEPTAEEIATKQRQAGGSNSMSKRLARLILIDQHTHAHAG